MSQTHHNILPRVEDLDPGFCHWLAGFTDGEGSFHIHRGRKSKSHSYYYHPNFTIKLRDDDSAILRSCQTITGCGSVYYHLKPGGNPYVRWEVSSKAHVCLLCDLFTLYPLRAKKARDFTHWAEAVKLKATVTTPTVPARNKLIQAEMALLKQRLESQRKYQHA